MTILTLEKHLESQYLPPLRQRIEALTETINTLKDERKAIRFEAMRAHRLINASKNPQSNGSTLTLEEKEALVAVFEEENSPAATVIDPPLEKEGYIFGWKVPTNKGGLEYQEWLRYHGLKPHIKGEVKDDN